MSTNMNYSKGNGWIVEEQVFDGTLLGKCEAIMSLGNGYMGIRSVTEERYLGEKRDFFIAGTFNKFDKEEVTELPNLADIVGMEIKIDGERFSLESGTHTEYTRQLNLGTGELFRQVLWISPKGVKVEFRFQRIVSMEDLHLIAQKVLIIPQGTGVEVELCSGIDGRMTNNGSQHLSDGAKRLYDRDCMQMVQTTEESGIDIVYNTTHRFADEDKMVELSSRIVMERRKIFKEYRATIEKGHTLQIEKISNAYTTRDLSAAGCSCTELQETSRVALISQMEKGYDRLALESAAAWLRKVWNQTPIEIESADAFDQLAIRFAQYHLAIMTPAHDKRMSIAAKGLSGEGYKGHTFWDTDIFVLPYFTYTNPKIARQLEEYRYLSLEGAHKKAASNGLEGAQFPWESAWLDDGEVTPVWGAADIITGLPTKIWSGFIEQHITADVAYGIWQYYMVTGDEEFMDRYGYELLLDTAKFWASRLEYSEEDQKYHINDVVGPDEYKEHADDNAFTNYMAHWNIRKAMEYYHILQSEKPELFQKLKDKMDLERVYSIWMDRVDQIYLPAPRELDLVIPQDKNYLTYKEIDLSKYKHQEHVGSMFLDYNLEQVNHIQVSKQADIMILFFLMEDLFSLEVKRANWAYYEPKTLHDSSLSLSTHSILANDMGDYDMAYELFRRATWIDLGPNMKTSDDGIHAASIGGIWQCVVYGFGGVRMLGGDLRIDPRLPEAWERLRFPIQWQGQELWIEVTKEELMVENRTKEKPVEFTCRGKMYSISDKTTINL